EQVGQPDGLVVGIPAPQRVETDLTSQGYGVHRIIAGDGDSDACGQHGRDRIRLGSHVEDGERGTRGGHGRCSTLRSVSVVKKSSMNSRASWPPSKPRHRVRSPPTNS